MTDRAVSEVLGYVLVFSVIVLTVTLVTISGEAGLAELRDSQRTENVEKGFSVLANNVDDVAQGGLPSRATELDLSGGEMSLGKPITVTVTTSDDGTVVFNRSRSIRPIVYQAPDGATLVYATGAVVIRGEGGGVTMLRSPRMVLTPNRSIVPVVDTSLDRRQLRGGEGSVDRESRVLIRTERRGRPTVASTDASVNLTITVSSPRASAWAEYLESAVDPSGDDCTVSGDTASCTFSTDRATVVLAPIAVSIE